MGCILYILLLTALSISFCWTHPTGGNTTTQPEVNNMDKMESVLDQLKDNAVLVGSVLQQVREDLNTIKTDQQIIKNDVKQLTTDQENFKTDMERMKTDLQLVKNDVNRIKTDQQDLKQDVDRTKTDKQTMWAAIEQGKKDQQDLKTYLMQRDKAMEEKIEMALTTGTRKAEDPIKMLAQLGALREFQKDNDFRPIEDIIKSNTPTVHKDCDDAYSKGWRKSGIYKIDPTGHEVVEVYCAQEIDAGNRTFKKAADFRQFMANLTETPFVPKDCQDAYARGWRQSGPYTISPDNITKIDVYCEQDLDGGGWTVFQKRMNDQVDFYRTWQEYKAGFGNVSTEYWLGNDALYHLTKHHDQALKVELKRPNGQVAFADYSQFYIDNEAAKYKLHISGFSGAKPPGDSLKYHNNQKFTTKDADNDEYIANCAQACYGAWWYAGGCHYSNLNGKYNGPGSKGLCWYYWGDTWSSMSEPRMMVR